MVVLNQLYKHTQMQQTLAPHAGDGGTHAKELTLLELAASISSSTATRHHAPPSSELQSRAGTASTVILEA